MSIEIHYDLAVAAQPPVGFGQTLIDDSPPTFRVFRSLDPARPWLHEMRSAR